MNKNNSFINQFKFFHAFWKLLLPHMEQLAMEINPNIYILNNFNLNNKIKISS